MLNNDSIKLRALEISDVEKLYIWENDTENWKVSHTITPFSRHVLIDYVNSVSDVFTDKQLRLIIEEVKSGEAIGAVDIFDCDFKNRRAGIGILIANTTKRQLGYASASLELLIPYCFKTLSLHQIYCNILSENAESIRLFEKFDFQRVGIKKEWTLHNGKYYDEILMQKISD